LEGLWQQQINRHIVEKTEATASRRDGNWIEGCDGKSRLSLGFLQRIWIQIGFSTELNFDIV